MISKVLRWIKLSKPINHTRLAHNIHIPIKHSHLLNTQLCKIKRILINSSHQNWGCVLQLEYLNEGVLLLNTRLMVPWAEPQHILLPPGFKHSQEVLGNPQREFSTKDIAYMSHYPLDRVHGV